MHRMCFLTYLGNETNIKALYYKPEGRVFQIRRGEYFSIFLILPVTIDHGVYSAFNRNEYQKHKNIISEE
jgi:hypothetical protein